MDAGQRGRTRSCADVYSDTATGRQMRNGRDKTAASELFRVRFPGNFSAVRSPRGARRSFGPLPVWASRAGIIY